MTDLGPVYRTLAWTSLIDHSLELCWVRRASSDWVFTGAVTLIEGSQPFAIDYDVHLDGTPGGTRFAGRVRRDGGIPSNVRVEGSTDGRWHMDGGTDDTNARVERAACIDLGWTPLTNTFSIWNLDLAVGAAADITNAWVPFPKFALTSSVQRYTRVGRDRYRYEQPAIDFSADLDVDDNGFVVRYGDIWAAVPVPLSPENSAIPVIGEER